MPFHVDERSERGRSESNVHEPAEPVGLGEPVRELSRRDSSGTTTIKFGAARYGPVAPLACQFGKYDVFTSTGLPISETWNEIVLDALVDVATTFVGSIARLRRVVELLDVDVLPRLRTRTRPRPCRAAAGFMNHGAAEHSHASETSASRVVVSATAGPSTVGSSPRASSRRRGSTDSPVTSGDSLPGYFTS